MNGNLIVKPLQAVLHTEEYEVVGRMDTYCVITVGASTHKTRTANNMGKNPNWKDTLEFEFSDNMSMTVSLWDHDCSDEGDFIGSTEISEILKLASKTNPTHWVSIYKKNPTGSGLGVESGKLLLQVEYYAQNQPGYKVAWRIEDFKQDGSSQLMMPTANLDQLNFSQSAIQNSVIAPIQSLQQTTTCTTTQQVLPESIVQTNYKTQQPIQTQYSAPSYTQPQQYRPYQYIQTQTSQHILTQTPTYPTQTSQHTHTQTYRHTHTQTPAHTQQPQAAYSRHTAIRSQQSHTHAGQQNTYTPAASHDQRYLTSASGYRVNMNSVANGYGGNLTPNYQASRY
jgi:C2 domain